MQASHTEELHVLVTVKLLWRRGMGRLYIGGGGDERFDVIGEKRLKDGMQSYGGGLYKKLTYLVC
jgi:hypothetical protein